MMTVTLILLCQCEVMRVIVGGQSLLLLNFSFSHSDSPYTNVSHSFSVNTTEDHKLNHNNVVLTRFVAVVQSVHPNNSNSESAELETLLESPVVSRTQSMSMVMLSSVNTHGMQVS